MSKQVKNAKFEFTGETKIFFGVTLNRIRAVAAIAAFGVAAGDLGGWIEREENLRVYGNAWVYGDARVYGNAQVYGDAQVSGDARVYGDAWVYGNAQVETVNITATRTDGYTFLVAPTPDGPRIIAGCRYFTFKEAKAHWKETRGGSRLGDESLAIVKHLETMAKLNGFDKPVKGAA